MSETPENPDAGAELVVEPPFDAGIHEELPAADYHAIEALSSSGIKHMLRSPLHYRYMRDNPDEATTAARSMGSALHLAILEPDLFESQIAVIPEDSPRRPSITQINAKKPSPATIAAVMYWEEFDAATEGRILLKSDQASIVDSMARSVRRHPVYSEYMTEGRRELSMLWRDARSQVPCKARFDLLRDDGIAIDLKSARDASADGFGRAAGSMNYHIQAAWYGNAHEHLLDRSLSAFVFVAVENEAPFATAVYVAQSNAIRFGIDRCEEALLLYAQARRSGYWRGYPEGVSPLQIPRWALTLQTPSVNL